MIGPARKSSSCERISEIFIFSGCFVARKNDFFLLPGSNVYSDKRGRPQYSSLIPFPRVGRSPGGAGMWYYGQKRGGKSGLIPFPRVGRAGANTWELPDEDHQHKGWCLLQSARCNRAGAKPPLFMISIPGVQVDLGSLPTKRQSLIPFPRVGKRDSISSKLSFYNSPKRDDFKRRITKKSYWNLPESQAFNRRIMRDHQPQKRQSLIPFPRTGKRSVGTNKEENQIYIFENPDGEDEDVGPMFAEAHVDIDFEDYDQLEQSHEFDVEDPELGRRVVSNEHTNIAHRLHLDVAII